MIREGDDGVFIIHTMIYCFILVSYHYSQVINIKSTFPEAEVLENTFQSEDFFQKTLL